MGCFEPGRIVVLPRPDGPLPKGKIESADQVLEGAELHPGSGGPLPVLVLVPVGKELEACADHLASQAFVAAAPNFYLAPQSPDVWFDEDVLLKLMAAIGASSEGNRGKNIRIGVLDSGWSPTAGRPAAPIQYFADRRPSAGMAGDSTGHGTTVLELTRMAAPDADVRSVRIMDSVGTLWSLLCGLSLAEAAFSPHILNISASFCCDSSYCAFCGRDGVSLDQIELLFWSTQNAANRRAPVVIAAAGNHENTCAIPSCLTDVIAVGAFDSGVRGTPAYARYESVPVGRFLLAPGGSDQGNEAFATSAAGFSGSARTPFYGTSFSAPLVSAIAARYLGELWCESCQELCQSRERPLPFLLDSLACTADRDFPGYDPRTHGLGVVRYAPAHRATDRVTSVASVLGRYPDSVRAMVNAAAAEIYARSGKPDGKAADHWAQARRKCAVPDGLHV